MENKEFKLSEMFCEDITSEGNFRYYSEENIREFINQLKLKMYSFNADDFKNFKDLKWIEKLAGSSLFK